MPGQPRTGTFGQGPGVNGHDELSVPMGDPPQLGTPNWQATFWASDAGAMVGSLTMTVTSVGPPIPPLTTGTMVDTATGMPDIVQTVTF